MILYYKKVRKIQESSRLESNCYFRLAENDKGKSIIVKGVEFSPITTDKVIPLNRETLVMDEDGIFYDDIIDNFSKSFKLRFNSLINLCNDMI